MCAQVLPPRPVRGFTLLELLIVLVILGILLTLAVPIYSGLRARAQRAACAANLRGLYIASDTFLQRNGSWPQIHAKDFETREALANAWIAALEPFGLARKNWICPTIQDSLQGPDYQDPAHARIDYVATPFDDKTLTPHQWPRQPWFIESGDVHGNGNLLIFADGSLAELNDVVPK